MTRTQLASQIVARAPLGAAGASGNSLERVTLSDGRHLVCKHVSPDWDWLSRATNDGGRALWMWSNGLFDRVPAVIEHATVAVEPTEAGWIVFMRDVSPAMVPKGAQLDRASLRQVLAATAELHFAFWGERVPELCSLQDRYLLNSPATVRREIARGHPVGPVLERCWEEFSTLVPHDVAAAIVAIAEQPALLAAQLDRCDQTLIHGDVRLANLGLLEDRIVLIDWGERTGSAPAPVELASFLAFDARSFDAPKEDVIAEFRSLYGDRFDDRALQLALIGGLVQLGCFLVLDIVRDGGDAARATALPEVTWWAAAVAAALETWSPI